MYCDAGSADCGRVRLSTGSAAGSYSGTLTATPTPAGSAGSVAVSLTVNPQSTVITRSPTALAFGTLSKDSQSAIKTITVSNSGGLAATLSWPLSYSGGSVAVGDYTAQAAGTTCTSGGTLGAGSSCVIAVQYRAGCNGGSRPATLSLQGPNFPSVSVTLTAATASAGACN